MFCGSLTHLHYSGERLGKRKTGLVHCGDIILTAVDHAQLFRLILFLGLLSTQSDLSGHHSLSFGDQRTLWAGTVFPSAVSFVTLF